MLPAYAELHCRSNFSFLTAASHPEELVSRAAQLGYAALAITDECSLAGVVRAHGAARQLGVHLVIGAEMQLTPATGINQPYVNVHVGDGESPPSLSEVERRHIELVLGYTGGNKARAARILGITAATLYNKLKLYKAADAKSP